MAKLRVGDWVEVRSKEEILRTLDGKARLDGMPFMPEMLAFCGKRFQVYKRAHKTCDTVFPVRGRRVDGAVHLDTRCDGSAHGGCQASCLLFWKEAWLKRVDNKAQAPKANRFEPTQAKSAAGACPESALWNSVLRGDSADGGPIYGCQATQLPYATTRLEWWDFRQYVEDYTSGNVSLWTIFCGAAYFLAYSLSQAGIGLGRPIRWLWDRLYMLWRGSPFPRRTGTILAGEPTPTQTLDLQPGEVVRVRSFRQILGTLDVRNKNRGLYFDAEEVPYCGKTYRVLKRVEKIIDDRTGKMREMKTPCLILDSVVCRSRYSECRLFCPRSTYAFWHEIWLERAKDVRPKNSERTGSLDSGLEPADKTLTHVS